MLQLDYLSSFLHCKSSLYFQIQIFIEYMVLTHFLSFCGLSFHFLNCVHRTKVLNFD